jgi:P27 family predicted phage terminase small subunit
MSPTKPTSKAPTSLAKSGRKFWESTMSTYGIEDAHHLALLTNACRCLDRAEEARLAIAKDGITIKNRFDEIREHPACNTERQSMSIFRQTVRELGLDIEPASAARGPRRPGSRN